MSKNRLWAADPHEFGPGKVHIVDDKDETKTMCGRFTSAIPGRRADASKPTCKTCLNAVVARPDRERQQQQWAKVHAERERQRAEDNERWQAWYRQYLSSPEWAERRRLVMERARGICEGCAVNKAVDVHHTTYAHAGDEFLWELRAVCRNCHERIHDSNHN